MSARLASLRSMQSLTTTMLLTTPTIVHGHPELHTTLLVLADAYSKIYWAGVAAMTELERAQVVVDEEKQAAVHEGLALSASLADNKAEVERLWQDIRTSNDPGLFLLRPNLKHAFISPITILSIYPQTPARFQ